MTTDLNHRVYNELEMRNGVAYWKGTDIAPDFTASGWWLGIYGIHPEPVRRNEERFARNQRWIMEPMQHRMGTP